MTNGRETSNLLEYFSKRVPFSVKSNTYVKLPVQYQAGLLHIAKSKIKLLSTIFWQR